MEGSEEGVGQEAVDLLMGKLNLMNFSLQPFDIKTHKFISSQFCQVDAYGNGPPLHCDTLQEGA